MSVRNLKKQKQQQTSRELYTICGGHALKSKNKIILLWLEKQECINKMLQVFYVLTCTKSGPTSSVHLTDNL